MMTQNTDKKREQIQMFCMDDLVPQDHLLRLIDRAIDWSLEQPRNTMVLDIHKCIVKLEWK